MFVLGKHTGGQNTNCLAYSPRGHLLASARHGVKLWDLRSRRELREIPSIGEVSSVTFAADNRLVVANGGRRAPVQIFDPVKGKLLEELGGTCKTQVALFSPDGGTLACGGHDHTRRRTTYEVLRWNMAPRSGGKPTPLKRHRRWSLVGHEREIGFIAFSPDGKRLASGSIDGKAILWDLKSRTPLARFDYRSGWRIVAFSPDGRTLAITAGKNIELWDANTFKRRRPLLRGHRQIVHAIAFTPDARTLLSGGGDGTVRLWDMASSKERACFDWGIGAIHNVAVAPDGLTAAAGSTEGDIVVWDLESS
jgi:WD40 repeat protein